MGQQLWVDLRKDVTGDACVYGAEYGLKNDEGKMRKSNIQSRFFSQILYGKIAI
ncbi:hypothetical protein [Photobacterium arenosum]|uniref:hypothetical protein n=1 Tax=Photobacterium arenosum TaxID=2774143 RepID=UPI00288BCFD3|nr:hypothetical protein [Photobacterium arenosum]